MPADAARAARSSSLAPPASLPLASSKQEMVQLPDTVGGPSGLLQWASCRQNWNSMLPSWEYVGDGRGAYEVVETLVWVGEGRGSIDIEDVSVEAPSSEGRAGGLLARVRSVFEGGCTRRHVARCVLHTIQILVLVGSVLLVVSLLHPGGSSTAGSTAADAGSDESAAASEPSPPGGGGGSSGARPAVGDDVVTTVAASAAAVVPPGGAALRLDPAVSAELTAERFDCALPGDASEGVLAWSPAHADFCCRAHGIGCRPISPKPAAAAAAGSAELQEQQQEQRRHAAAEAAAIDPLVVEGDDRGGKEARDEEPPARPQHSTDAAPAPAPAAPAPAPAAPAPAAAADRHGAEGAGSEKEEDPHLEALKEAQANTTQPALRRKAPEPAGEARGGSFGIAGLR